MAQTKTTRRTPAGPAPNREAARRNAAPSRPAPGRGGLPLAASGRGGRPSLNVVQFIRDTRSELRKVVWPTRQETTNLTIVVLAFSVAVALFLGAVDFVFQEFFRTLLSVTGVS